MKEQKHTLTYVLMHKNYAPYPLSLSLSFPPSLLPSLPFPFPSLPPLLSPSWALSPFIITLAALATSYSFL